ncbi:hypothetical protein ABZW11_34010 [Nonomuraea sp. NPDC004580]|uniref:hypothetical protein n=1 Tax=Nonomuraea sp. NPDC004580 TaxID=3154552 RepID=UPI0033B22415
MRLVKQLVAVAAVAFAGNALAGAMSGNAFFTLFFGLGMAVLAVYVYGRVVRWTEKREPVEVALEGARGALGRGVLIGVAMFVAVILNGHEGGPYAVVFGLLLTGVFLYVARKRGNLVPRRRRTGETLVRTP